MGKGPKATEEQLLYAGILDKGMKVGIVMLFVSFTVYLTGILSPYVPVNDLPKLWTLKVHDYLQAAHIEHGWWWTTMLHKGDFLNFAGIAFLGSVTIICFVAIIPTFFKKKDYVYGIMAIIEVLVLVLAASGILKSGGH
jgi:hypothetical protein